MKKFASSHHSNPAIKKDNYNTRARNKRNYSGSQKKNFYLCEGLNLA